MNVQRKLLVIFLLSTVCGKFRRPKARKFTASVSKGTQCYNCLSFDHPGCWDPEHPDFDNTSIPNIDCYIHGMSFLCIVITSESAKLVDSGQEIGPVRARTCVPSRDFAKKTISYAMCAKLASELAASEIFTRVTVTRPQCTLCKTHLCTDAQRC